MEKNEFLKLKPMLLHEVTKPFDDKDYIYEIKFDGIRALIFIDDGKIIIKSRRGIILNDTFPELLNIVNITKETCVFDGEIVLIDEDKPSFSKLQERTRLKNVNKINYMKENHPVNFVCFDILYKDNDLTTKTLIERKEILNTFKDNEYFIKSKFIEEHGINLFNAIKIENLEGIVAKKKDSLYKYDIRTKDWLKIKYLKDEVFYICGYIVNKNKYTMSIVLGEKIDNKYIFVGKVVLSHNNPLFDKVLKEKETKSYVENYENNKVKFIKPKYKLEINYTERTKNNMLRHAQIKKDF